MFAATVSDHLEVSYALFEPYKSRVPFEAFNDNAYEMPTTTFPDIVKF